MKTGLLAVALVFLTGCRLLGQQVTYVAPQTEDEITPYEKSGKTATATYEECRDFYRAMHALRPEITTLDSWTMDGESRPVYIFRINTGADPFPLKVLVMNNIHPGEPEGTDASMLLTRQIIKHHSQWAVNVLNHIDLTIICQYNVDGTCNRSCCTRANQNGPEKLGFRGTNMNLDLNRDFIKCDSRNAMEFSRLMAENRYHIFIDNHTSNGADYQYTLTWFHTRPEKLEQLLVPGMETLAARLTDSLNNKGIPTAPYVDTRKSIPDSGIVAFWESPRFSTGFAALHHCLGFTVETHMWKPYPDRVEATLAFMKTILATLNDEKLRQQIISSRRKLDLAEGFKRGQRQYIQWKLDEKQADTILFLGYKSSYPVHELTGLPLLQYDRNSPLSMNIPYYKYYLPTDSVSVPRLYLIPSAWKGKILPRLRANGIKVKFWPNDTTINLRVSYIVGYETTKTPYEGHYLHYNTSTLDTVMPVRINAGDMAIKVTDGTSLFLTSVLEPRSPDSYFNWGFFDPVLQQKEWFSDYVWADKAKEILDADPILKAAFEKEKQEDAGFAASSWAQLAWVYRHSVYYEASHNRLPVYRLD